MGAAFLGALVVVLLIFHLVTGTKEQLSVALRVTARWSFLWFWLASTGSALATLFGPTFQSLAQRGRDFGLAFASAHVIHLGLVAWVLHRSPTPFPQSVPPLFGIGVLWVYLLALLSIKSVSAKLPPRILRTVRIVGIEYITLAFLVDFAKNPFEFGLRHLVTYLPFLILTVAGPLLRAAAAAKRLSHRRPLTPPNSRVA
jgi:hypothetical protein